jgi:hypothetical protein
MTPLSAQHQAHDVPEDEPEERAEELGACADPAGYVLTEQLEETRNHAENPRDQGHTDCSAKQRVALQTNVSTWALAARYWRHSPLREWIPSVVVHCPLIHQMPGHHSRLKITPYPLSTQLIHAPMSPPTAQIRPPIRAHSEPGPRAADATGALRPRRARLGRTPPSSQHPLLIAWPRHPSLRIGTAADTVAGPSTRIYHATLGRSWPTPNLGG